MEEAMRIHLVRALIVGLALGAFALPVEAQRRSRGNDRDASRVEVDVRIRNGRPSVRLLRYDRSYYGPTGRYRVSLRRLARTSRQAYRRVVRDHRELHRRMRRVRDRRR